MNTFPDSRLVVFLSADIVGSTRFKDAAGPAMPPAWLQPFARFFRELPLVMIGQLALACADSDDVPDLRVWRVAGDEIIFAGEPRDTAALDQACTAFCRTIADYDRRLAADHGLRLRGTAWGARIPGSNIEIEVPELGGADGGAYREYIGPDVDTGFRLAKAARGGEVVVSVLLARALGPDAPALRQRGHVALSGLFADRPYPVLLADPDGTDGLDPDHLTRLAADVGDHSPPGLRPTAPW